MNDKGKNYSDSKNHPQKLKIRLYLKTTENFMHLILKSDFGLCIYHLVVWFVYIIFGRMVEFQFLAVNHLSKLVMPSLVLILH